MTNKAWLKKLLEYSNRASVYDDKRKAISTLREHSQFGYSSIINWHANEEATIADLFCFVDWLNREHKVGE